jgi:hypothetical protein
VGRREAGDETGSLLGAETRVGRIIYSEERQGKEGKTKKHKSKK